jgi:hypothetical protein
MVIINLLTQDAMFVILLIIIVRQIRIMQQQGSQQLARLVTRHPHGQARHLITHGSRQTMEMQTEYALPVIRILRTILSSNARLVMRKLRQTHSTEGEQGMCGTARIVISVIRGAAAEGRML